MWVSTVVTGTEGSRAPSQSRSCRRCTSTASLISPLRHRRESAPNERLQDACSFLPLVQERRCTTNLGGGRVGDRAHHAAVRVASGACVAGSLVASGACFAARPLWARNTRSMPRTTKTITSQSAPITASIRNTVDPPSCHHHISPPRFLHASMSPSSWPRRDRRGRSLGRMPEDFGPLSGHRYSYPVMTSLVADCPLNPQLPVQRCRDERCRARTRRRPT